MVGSLAPPPFPFTMVVAVANALTYSRLRLLKFELHVLFRMELVLPQQIVRNGA